MILSTPHPPETSSETPPSSGAPPGLFTVRTDFTAEEALVAIAEYLDCASATAWEVADHHSTEFRPLASSVVHQVDSARLLVEAMLESLGHD